MRDIDVSNFLGRMPRITLKAYDVSINSAGYRTLTSHTAYDIAPEYIDMDSIHFEWAQCPGDTFEPGGCIPSHLELRLLSSYAGTNPLTPTYAPTNASDYSVLYKMQINYGIGGNIYSYGAPMVLVAKSSMRNSDSVKLVFEDELTMFDNIPYDLASKTVTYKDVVSNIFATAGINPSKLTGIDSILSGANYYTGGELSARQVLSYILQANGCYIFANSNDGFTIKTLRSVTPVGELASDYVMDYSFGECSGRWDHALMIVDGDPITYSTGNYPNTYLFRNNPLVIEGNKTTYADMLTNRVSYIDREGFEVKYAFHQAIEPGDYLKINYKPAPTTTTYKNAIISRITWDGGAFFTLKECEFDRFNKL